MLVSKSTNLCTWAGSGFILGGWGGCGWCGFVGVFGWFWFGFFGCFLFCVFFFSKHTHFFLFFFFNVSVYKHTYIKPLLFLPGRKVQYILNSLAQHTVCPRSPQGLSCLSMRRAEQQRPVTLTSLLVMSLAWLTSILSPSKHCITDLALHPKSSVNQFICNC